MGKIIMTFDEEGNVQAETQGFKGTSCKDASAFIEKALGKVTDFKKTREYYEKEDNKNVIRR